MPAVAAGHASKIETELQQRRAALAGTPGIVGLVQNLRTTLICVFASTAGLIYGYNQGMFGQVLSMNSFSDAAGTEGISNPTLAGLLTSILELGAWIGVLGSGISADVLGRKLSVVIACGLFIIGVIVQACTNGGHWSYILAGRLVTGLGVGGLSLIVPLYNAEVAAPEVRGALVALQQLAITFGIMISYWLTYGTNHIGGTGDSQSSAAWLVPITIQILPAIILGIFINMMPSSPRWLMNQGREEDCLNVIAGLRRQPTEAPLVQLEFLEIKAQRLFELRVSAHDHPDLQDGSTKSNFKLGLAGYKSLFKTRPNLKRTSVAILIMLFQQWTGVNFILYYAPFIFESLQLPGATTSLLASGVVGVVMFLATIPAVLYLDKWGRKPTLIAGALLMGLCHFIVAGIIAECRHDWLAHRAAGWAAAVMIWLFAIGFGFSWGPTAWVIIAETFPLGLRAKGVSIGASSNWLNNFAVAMSTPDFVDAAPYGAYIFLGAMCMAAIIYVYFFVPETKNRSLEEIDALFGDQSGRSRWEAELLLQAQIEVGLLSAAQLSVDEPTKEIGTPTGSASDEKDKHGIGHDHREHV